MTVKECYDKMNGDYEDAMSRFGSEALVERFMLKFLKQNCLEEILKAVDEKDIEASFRAAHTLKGVAANVSLKAVAVAASELTEQLRPQTEQASRELVDKVASAYQLAAAVIEEYESEQEGK